MKRTIGLTLCALMFAAPLYAAQLYRWVDDKGNVEWRDTPPPAAAKKVEQRTIHASTIPTSELPYSVQQAAKNFPVTLWATDCGDLCNRARAHLARRGVPYTDKDPQADFEAFKKASGGGAEVPLLLVGAQRLKGYLESEWDSTLDFAGYPKTALVAVKPKIAPAKPAAKPAVTVKLYTSPDCGPRCGQAKALLSGRGVPFQEIVADTPTAIEELRKVAGDVFVPTLIAGRFVVRGFEPGDYESALEQAGFQQKQAAAKP
ncbi:MAG TPA: glutaredoxin family protein [Burkholderiales bacterium]|nr:glutaredoxin family protein [Burkholderiales bacterium]